jgi:hypothetical protein
MAALTNPIAAAFTAEAQVLVGVFAYLLTEWGTAGCRGAGSWRCPCWADSRSRRQLCRSGRVVGANRKIGTAVAPNHASRLNSPPAYRKS